MTEEAKTFLQWVGSKSRLLRDFSIRLPQRFIDGEPTIYIEPVVGGGSMLFYMLSKYGNIVSVKINDINERLTVSIQRYITCLSTKKFVQEIVVRNYCGTLYDRMRKNEQTSLF